MKTIIFLASCITLNLHASIILDSNVEFIDAWMPGEYSLRAYATESISVDWQGTTILNRNDTQISAIKELAIVMLELTLSSFGSQIGTGTPMQYDTPLDIGYGDFYISVIAREWGSSPTQQGRGWVLLNNSPTEGLTMKSNAMAYGEYSLTVGAIPEPATVLLFGLGGFSALILRRNKRNNKN